MSSINSTTDIKYVAWSKNPDIQGGDECVPGSRVRRIDLRAYKKLFGVEDTHYHFPQIPIENIEQA